MGWMSRAKSTVSETAGGSGFSCASAAIARLQTIAIAKANAARQATALGGEWCMGARESVQYLSRGSTFEPWTAVWQPAVQQVPM